MAGLLSSPPKRSEGGKRSGGEGCGWGALPAYPYLEAGDIEEALRYAAFLAEDETVELARPG
jgi:hypothetical protein